jgi:hypothetical protein
MELLLASVALIVAVASLVLAFRLRHELAAASRVAAAASAATEQALATTGRELEALRRELDALRASTQSPPPPPLPRTRRAGLDDLRAQLKASQQSDHGEQEG